jgi:hypothetical protein
MMMHLCARIENNKTFNKHNVCLLFVNHTKQCNNNSDKLKMDANKVIKYFYVVENWASFLAYTAVVDVRSTRA